MPAQGVTQNVRGVPADGACGGEVIIQRLAVIRVHAFVDDDPGTLSRCQASQVCQTHFGHEDVDVMFGVVDICLLYTSPSPRDS